jgi:hypothetical protein
LNADKWVTGYVKELVDVRWNPFLTRISNLYSVYCLPAHGTYILQQLQARPSSNRGSSLASIGQRGMLLNRMITLRVAGHW